jgi:hypothetical protein
VISSLAWLALSSSPCSINERLMGKRDGRLGWRWAGEGEGVGEDCWPPPPAPVSSPISPRRRIIEPRAESSCPKKGREEIKWVGTEITNNLLRTPMVPLIFRLAFCAHLLPQPLHWSFLCRVAFATIEKMNAFSVVFHQMNGLPLYS